VPAEDASAVLWRDNLDERPLSSCLTRGMQYVKFHPNHQNGRPRPVSRLDPESDVIAALFEGRQAVD